MSLLPPSDLENPLDPQPAGTASPQRQSQSQLQDAPAESGSGPRHRGSNRPHRGRYQPRNPNYRLSGDELRNFASVTLKKLDEGSYILPHTKEPYDLAAKIKYTNENTFYCPPDDSAIENWFTADLGVPADSTENKTNILIKEYSTLVGARRLHGYLASRPEGENKTIGILNFASAKRPGGGFIKGSQAQEESIARASTLYPSLISEVGMQFYEPYTKDPNNAYYTHAMTYSPSVVLFRNDIGNWMKPVEVDVLTSAAVNAGKVRYQVKKEEDLRLLKERVEEAERLRELKRENLRLEKDKVDMQESNEAKSTEHTAEETEKIEQELGGKISQGVEDGSENAANEPEKDGPKPKSKTPDIPETLTENDPTTLPQTTGDGEQPAPSDPAEDPFYLAEVQIDVQMYERIGRLLYLFHKRGAKHLVLGSFGTGVFQNRVELVAGIFYDLLAKPDARFKNVFDTVVFAILGGWTVRVFKEVFGNTAIDRIGPAEEEVDEEGSEVEGMKDGQGESDVEKQKLSAAQGDGKGQDDVEEKIITEAQADEKKEEQQVEQSREPTSYTTDVEMADLTHETPIEPNVDFDKKRSYFNQQLHRNSDAEEHYETLQLNVRRARVFEDSFLYLQRKTGEQIKHGKLSVRFYDEEGVDVGGLTREWFQVLARQTFNPSNALFQRCAAVKPTYQPNKNSWVNPEHLSFFKFVGRVIGKAIFDGHLLDAHFARSLYRQLLGKPVDYKDVEWVDAEYYNSLCWILENDPTALNLTFSVESEEFGVNRIVPLKEGGETIPVTQENKREFVQLSAQYRLYSSIKEQIESLCTGFYEIIPKDLIAIFNEQELELLISGTPDIDVDKWRAATYASPLQPGDTQKPATVTDAQILTQTDA